MVKLNLGCGNKRKEGYVGVDLNPCDALDVCCDITRGLPFANGSVDAVLMDNVIEHILDIPSLMHELKRVCRGGAEIDVITPHFTSISSWCDPTHLHHLTWASLDYFKQGEFEHFTCGGFEIARKKLSFGGGIGLIGRLLFAISPDTWERHFCFVFRASTLRVTLRTVN